MRALLLSLLAATLLLGTAQAQPNGDPAGDLNRTVDDTRSLLDKTLDGVEGAASGLGDAAQATGDGVSDGASALGRVLASAAKAVGRAAAAVGDAVGTAALASLRIVGEGVAWTGRATTSAGLASALTLSAGVLGAGAALGGSVEALGAGTGGLVVLSASLLAASGQFVGGILGDGLLSYVGLVSGLRPDAMPVAVFGTIAVTGAAASTGVGGWAGWAALKKWGWMGAGGIAGFSRIADDDLLEHPLRSQIFQVIQSNPGIHASGLARQVGAGWGTITHHLEKLERGHLVATRKINNQKCFFEQGGKVSRLDMAVAGAVRGDTAGDIAQYVLGHPMTSQKEMAQDLGISPALVSFHVKKLVNLGVLDKVRHGKETLLTTSDALRRVLAAEQSAAVHVELKDESFSYTS